MRTSGAVILCLAALACPLLVQSAISPVSQQVSFTYDPTYADPAQSIPLSNPLFVKNTTGLDPDQIHITYVSPTEVVVSWTTGDGLSYASPVPSYQGTDGIATDVYYGTSSDSYTQNASGYTTEYSQVYTFVNNASWPAINYSSPVIHHCPLTGLKPNTTYYYVVGDPALGLSQEYAFTTGPSAAQAYPFRLGVIADLGSTLNSTQTIAHLMADNPQVWTLIGDLVYADDVAANGTGETSTTSPGPGTTGTYQPRWDGWFRWLQPLMATIPFIPQHGNHELEPQGQGVTGGGYGLYTTSQFPKGTQFQSYINRNPTNVAAAASGSSSPLYYSVNVGPAHMVYLSNYDQFDEGTPQYEWLANDLATFNRTATPWLIATFHAPWYCSFQSHYMENQCMREAMETLLYENGVSFVLNGHVHAYERSYPVYNMTVDMSCGISHIVLGDGGNIEGQSKTYSVQGNSTTCPAPKIPSYQPGGFCADASYNFNGQYCPPGQPSWSAYRQPAYGHGIFDFINATHCHYTWNRNVNGQSVEADDVYLVRDLSCPNQGGYPALSPTTGPTSTAGK